MGDIGLITITGCCSFWQLLVKEIRAFSAFTSVLKLSTLIIGSNLSWLACYLSISFLDTSLSPLLSSSSLITARSPSVVSLTSTSTEASAASDAKNFNGFRFGSFANDKGVLLYCLACSIAVTVGLTKIPSALMTASLGAVTKAIVLGESRSIVAVEASFSRFLLWAEFVGGKN